jgi:hypothetical protein
MKKKAYSKTYKVTLKSWGVTVVAQNKEDARRQAEEIILQGITGRENFIIKIIK